MEIAVKQYEMAVNNAAEISQTLLNMEGGRYILAMFSELFQELLEVGNNSGAALIVQKLHEVAEVPFEQMVLDENNTAAWSSLFSETLSDTLEDGIF